MPGKNENGRRSEETIAYRVCENEVKNVVIVGKFFKNLLQKYPNQPFLFFFKGNGPSAISLSYMLSGNVPYYVGEVSDEYLHKRLTNNRKETIFLQDIEELSTVRI